MPAQGYISYDGMEIDSDSLAHYGVLRKSGRYPWGSGENPHQRSRSFIDYVDSLRKEGMSEAQVATALGISTTKLRAVKAIAKNEIRAQNESTARRLKEKQLSNTAIAEKMGINESSVRALLDPSYKAKNDILVNTADRLRKEVDEKGYLDVGLGVSNHLGIADTKMNTAISMLEEEGYVVINNLRSKQLNSDNQTPFKVLAKPGTTFADAVKNIDNIKTINMYTEDGGRNFKDIPQTPVSISSKRVKVLYGDEGGVDADGVIYIRPGVDDLNMGKSRYAQVRIAVDDSHYLKGMAIYKDDMPDGVDVIFNTNKSNTGDKHDAMKPFKADKDNPFGATISRQNGVLNIVSEEGTWEDWSRTLSSQMLSKQRPEIAQKQLDLYYNKKRAQLDEINALTNPVIKKRLLEDAADDFDTASVSLKAAAVPRMANHVILPLKSLKPNEIFAPNYDNGEVVALIRHPHGGVFEIPQLVVNNRNQEGRKYITNTAKDAVGINSKVAQQLSGADFDGDTVMVIPNNNGAIKTSKPLASLKNFDPQSAYPSYPGMQRIDKGYQQKQMGVVSNLITDMTIKGASDAEIARAVRHSMVIIDAEKHKLNWKQSKKDENITELQRKYQMRPDGNFGGTSTIVSRSKSEKRIDERRERKASEGGKYDPITGEKVYVNTGAVTRTGKSSKTGKTIYLRDGQDYRIDKATGEKEYAKPGTIKETKKQSKVRAMELVDDAHTLSSGTQIEKIYADHANKMKVLANDARKGYLATKPIRYDPSANKKYHEQVRSLNASLDKAYRNKPLERQAQLAANAMVKQKLYENPGMEKDEVKKLKARALKISRDRVGASANRVNITDLEWEAIQNGAISNNKLSEIIANADIDRVKELATPKTRTGLTSANESRARSMATRGYSRAEIADALGVSTSTLSEVLSG